MPRSTCLQRQNGPGRPLRYHNFTEYRLEVTASSVALHPIKESFGGPLSSPSPHSPVYQIPISTQEAGDNALITPTEFRMSIGGGDHLLSGVSHARLLL